MTILQKILAACAGAMLLALTGCASAAQQSPVPKDFSVTLERSICFGWCPDYRVSVAADGLVRYEGRTAVAVRGSATRNISRTDVARLYHAFEAANIFAFDDKYRSRATDLPTYRLSFMADGRSKTITDYGGRMIGMPQAITELEKMVDDVAGTERWVQGAKEK
jgi:hypothetical protein